MARIIISPALAQSFAAARQFTHGTAAHKAARKAAWAAVRTAYPATAGVDKLGFDDTGDNAYALYFKGSNPRQYLDDGVVAQPAAAPRNPAYVYVPADVVAMFANANDLYYPSDKKAAKKACWAALRAAHPGLPTAKLGFDDTGDNAYALYFKGSDPRSYVMQVNPTAEPAQAPQGATSTDGCDAQCGQDTTTHAFDGALRRALLGALNRPTPDNSATDALLDLLDDLTDSGYDVTVNVSISNRTRLVD